MAGPNDNSVQNALMRAREYASMPFEVVQTPPPTESPENQNLRNAPVAPRSTARTVEDFLNSVDLPTSEDFWAAAQNTLSALRNNPPNAEEAMTAVHEFFYPPLPPQPTSIANPSREQVLGPADTQSLRLSLLMLYPGSESSDTRTLLQRFISDTPRLRALSSNDDTETFRVRHLGAVYAALEHRVSPETLSHYARLSYQNDSLSAEDAFSAAVAIDILNRSNPDDPNSPIRVGESLIEYQRRRMVAPVVTAEQYRQLTILSNATAGPLDPNKVYRYSDLLNARVELARDTQRLQTNIERLALENNIEELSPMDRMVLEASVNALAVNTSLRYANRMSSTPTEEVGFMDDMERVTLEARLVNLRETRRIQQPFRDDEITGTIPPQRIYSALYEAGMGAYLADETLASWVDDMALHPNPGRNIDNMDYRQLVERNRAVNLETITMRDRFRLELAMNTIASRTQVLERMESNPQIASIDSIALGLNLPVDSVDGVYEQPEIMADLGELIREPGAQEVLAGSYPTNTNYFQLMTRLAEAEAIAAAPEPELPEQLANFFSPIPEAFARIAAPPPPVVAPPQRPTLPPDEYQLGRHFINVFHITPVEDGARRSSDFGEREVPIGSDFHMAHDFAPKRLYMMHVNGELRVSASPFPNVPLEHMQVRDLPTQIRASEEGAILFAARDHPIYGNCIIVRHGDDSYTLYAHCERFLTEIPDELFHTVHDEQGSLITNPHNNNQPMRMFYNAAALEFPANPMPAYHVYQGDPLGIIGQTGLADGPHLHYAQATEIKHDLLQAGRIQAFYRLPIYDGSLDTAASQNATSDNEGLGAIMISGTDRRRPVAERHVLLEFLDNTDPYQELELYRSLRTALHQSGMSWEDINATMETREIYKVMRQTDAELNPEEHEALRQSLALSMRQTGLSWEDITEVSSPGSRIGETSPARGAAPPPPN